MNSIRGGRHEKATVNESVAAIESKPRQSVVPYDENLLECARTQWQFGDWHSLAMLNRDSLQHHPDRAKLALLAAAGQFQVGNQDTAHQLVRLAMDWGCSSRLVMQLLAAGVHNSLGRALAQAGNREGAYAQFEKAVRLGAPTSDTRLIAQARVREQLVQLGLKSRENRSGEISGANSKADNLIEFVPNRRFLKSPISVEMFYSDKDADRISSLDELKNTITQSSETANLPGLAWVSVSHRNKTFFFAHFSEDYIPGKMAEKNLFYEAPFLNLLARLYEPGKLIIDGGANIGNHSVFFAGVMGAPVIAFEPQPYNFTFLLSNVYLNRLENKIDVRRTAIGDKMGRIELTQAIANNFGTFTADMALIPGGDMPGDGVKKFEVNVSTLDEELANFKHMVSIIKLDLEGMELAALHGAKQIILESMPVIAVECFTKAIYQSVKDFLATFDYFVIDSTNATPTFIFLSRKNPVHHENLSKYLEISSVGKFSSNKSFNQSSE